MDLVNEHEDNGGITETVLGEEGECIGMVEKLVSEGPVHGGGRRQGEGEDVYSC